MKYLTFFARLTMFICVLALSFTLYSSMDKPSPPTKSNYVSRDAIHHDSTKQANKNSQKILQEKAKQKRAEKIINARDKLIREKGYKVYKYGDKRIIKAKGVVKPDFETHPSKKGSSKKKEEVPKDYDMNYPESQVTQKEGVDENKEPEEVIVEEKVENFIYRGEEEGYSQENESVFESKKDENESQRVVKNRLPINDHLITLNNNLQYDLTRDAYIFWVTPIPETLR